MQESQPTNGCTMAYPGSQPPEYFGIGYEQFVDGLRIQTAAIPRLDLLQSYSLQ